MSNVIPVFSRGRWVSIDVTPFSDPALTEGQRRFAASVVAAEIGGGASEEAAVQTAEKRLYARIFVKGLDWVSGK
jgi:hypothetical protein